MIAKNAERQERPSAEADKHQSGCSLESAERRGSLGDQRGQVPSWSGCVPERPSAAEAKHRAREWLRPIAKELSAKNFRVRESTERRKHRMMSAGKALSARAADDQRAPRSAKAPDHRGAPELGECKHHGSRKLGPSRPSAWEAKRWKEAERLSDGSPCVKRSMPESPSSRLPVGNHRADIQTNKQAQAKCKRVTGGEELRTEKSK